ncbi:MAG: gentisate 1,2-dioxygenase [Bradyrhizobium sp.]|jgi:gentisate 1,2-dioxygenase
MTAEASDRRAAYYARVAEKHMTPLWTIMSEAVPDEPRPRFAPAFWDYDADIRPSLIEAADLISAEEAQRRVLVLNNPSLPRGATHTLFCALQLIKQGEVAPAHRHTQSALRFVVEGSGAYTAVNGEKTAMAPGDFIVTPAWCWHDHGKETDGTMIWVDGLDIPFVNHLGATFGEDYAAPRYPEQRQPDDSAARFGAGLLPVDAPKSSLHSPVFSYPYARAREALEKLRRGDWDAAHGIKLKYANPLNGDYALPTIASFLQLLPKGFRSLPYRSTEGAVFIVAEGRGRVKIGDQLLSFKKNDIFVAPNWTWYSFETSEDAVLFSYSDRAVLEKVGLWREQRGNAPAGY